MKGIYSISRRLFKIYFYSKENNICVRICFLCEISKEKKNEINCFVSAKKIK